MRRLAVTHCHSIADARQEKGRETLTDTTACLMRSGCAGRDGILSVTERDVADVQADPFPWACVSTLASRFRIDGCNMCFYPFQVLQDAVQPGTCSSRIFPSEL